MKNKFLFQKFAFICTFIISISHCSNPPSEHQNDMITEDRFSGPAKIGTTSLFSELFPGKFCLSGGFCEISPISPPGDYLNELQIFSNQDAWLVGPYGNILHFDGSVWSKVKTPNNQDTFLMSSSFAPKQVWVYSQEGNLLLCNEQECAQQGKIPDPFVSYYSIWAASEKEVWLLLMTSINKTEALRLYHYDNGTITSVSVENKLSSPILKPAFTNVTNLWGSASHDIWLACTLEQAPGKPGKTVALHYDGTDWKEEPISATTDPAFQANGFTGTKTGEMWLAGTKLDNNLAANGVVLYHYESNKWSLVNTPTLSSIKKMYEGIPFQQIQGDLWLAGYDSEKDNRSSILAHYDSQAKTWKLITSAPFVFRNFWPLSETQIRFFLYFNGFRGWDGVSFQEIWKSSEPIDVSSDIAVGGQSSQDFWFATDGKLYHTNREKNATVYKFTDNEAIDTKILTIQAAGNDVWFGGNQGQLFRATNSNLIYRYQWDNKPDDNLNSSSHSPHKNYSFNSRLDAEIVGIFATSEQDVWAIAKPSNQVPFGFKQSAILHFNGTSWEVIKKLEGILYSVSGTSSHDVWFGGENLLFHFDGTEIIPFPLPWNQVSIHQIYAASPNDVWFLVNGHLYHYNGANFQEISLPSLVHTDQPILIKTLFGSSEGNVWVLKTSGELFHFDKKGWSLIEKLYSTFSSNTVLFGTDQDLWYFNIDNKYLNILRRQVP